MYIIMHISNVQLPTYILSPNTHDKSFISSRLVKLGGNELHCDCNTAKYLKVIYLEYNLNL